ncbi:hypothetical protein ZEAMMB73_Zm00001d013503 [Zea mays]|uniref:BEACH domain-containing protein n=2 Tax=Zea mays TaxID=4577 RepID=A0A1D6GK55_MAIZE|nr:hypothetical protein ZEAMMB73_Zm00001d013503 [Zea mays]AQK63731.1 hypothetical protein ZEAMMB73_Zm00001d013503 [Zea mays]
MAPQPTHSRPCPTDDRWCRPLHACDHSTMGGKFDHVDRLFQSMESAYINSLSNTSDVKELIPEFFYMCEFPENSNSYHIGWGTYRRCCSPSMGKALTTLVRERQMLGIVVQSCVGKE